MKIPHADLIERLRRAQGDAETAQLLEAAANRLQELDIECATLRHGLRLANRRADEAADRLRQEEIMGQVLRAAQGERQPDLWIPVHESRAPVDADLLLTISTGKVVVGMWHSNFGWDWADTGDVADEEAHVTHWRLFPMAAVNA